MKTFGIMLAVIGVLLLVVIVICGVVCNYGYTSRIGSYWSLSEKASSITLKSEYMDKYVDALSKAGLQGTYNAAFLKTPDNSFDANFIALQSLQARLWEIKTMDVTSFQYQTAIQQITAQEQGEADKMTCTLYRCWVKNNYPLLWNWWCLLTVIIDLAMIVVGIAIWCEEY